MSSSGENCYGTVSSMDYSNTWWPSFRSPGLRGRMLNIPGKAWWSEQNGDTFSAFLPGTGTLSASIFLTCQDMREERPASMGWRRSPGSQPGWWEKLLKRNGLSRTLESRGWGGEMKYCPGALQHRVCSLPWLRSSPSWESGELSVRKPCLKGKHLDYSNCPECDVSWRIKGQRCAVIWLLSLIWGYPACMESATGSCTPRLNLEAKEKPWKIILHILPYYGSH